MILSLTKDNTSLRFMSFHGRQHSCTDRLTFFVLEAVKMQSNIECKKRSGRVSRKQQKLLINFMKEHLEFAQGKLQGMSGKIINERLWTELAERLNSEKSGPLKDVDKWRKTWQDWRSATKKAAFRLRVYCRERDGSPPPKPLNDLEKEMLEIIGDSFEDRMNVKDVRLNLSQASTVAEEKIETTFKDAFLQDYSIIAQKKERNDTSIDADAAEPSSSIMKRSDLEIPSSTQSRRKFKHFEGEDYLPETRGESARIEYALYRLAAAQEDRNEIFRELTTYIKRYLEK